MSDSTAPSWGQAESAAVAELARGAVVEVSGQSNVRTARVDLRGETAIAYVLMLGGERAIVWLAREFGQWKVTGVSEAS